MAIILKFSIERIKQAEPAMPGQHCMIIPFPHPPHAQEPPKIARKSKSAKPKSKRGILISKVKIAQKQLGINDADYRALLHQNFNADSCTELDEHGLARLISYFRSKGWQDAPSGRRPKDAHTPKCLKSTTHPLAPVMSRISALLTELGSQRGEYVPWAYAASILEMQSGFNVLDAATINELQKVMVALERTVNFEKRKRV